MSTTEIKPAPGRHAAVLRSVQFQAPKTSDKSTQVVMGFELTDPEDYDCGTFITYFGSTSDAALEHTVKALGNCGWTGDDFSELPGMAERGELAETVSLVVDHEEFEGKWRAKVKWVNGPGGGKIKIERPLDGAGLEDFGARMKSRIRAARGSSSSGSRQSRPANGAGSQRSSMPPQRDAPSPVDDDVPF